MIVKSNPDTVWADTTVFTVGSEKCIPLNMLTSGKGAAIYYTPKDFGKLSNTDALRKKNCLKYSISANNKKTMSMSIQVQNFRKKRSLTPEQRTMFLLPCRTFQIAPFDGWQRT